MPRPLVIVESPAKAKTIARLLGGDFVVESSFGHVRDLPRNASEVPAAYKSYPWSRLGVDVDNDFKPLYVVTKKDQVKKLKALVREASELYLATDEDREGESIAWHLLEVLGPQVPVRRMVFHEITRAAIERAVAEPRTLDERLVDAQETRRIFDRLYGYEVSPVLWKKVMGGLSAGRVQSVATRLLVDRERERMRFRSASWWGLVGTFASGADAGAGAEPASTSFTAELASVDGRRLVTGKDFGPTGELGADAQVVRLDEDGARGLAARLAGADFAVRTVDQKPYRRSPYPPFMTSTLQQEAGRKLGFAARRTMEAAQRLYENGYITYMRTDSTTLSDTALEAARALVREKYGPAYLPDKPRVYAKKVKNAQEAHEAIRPAGESFRLPEDVRREVASDEARLYELIWMRTVASQMTDAVGQTVTVRIAGTSSAGEDAEFATSGTVITFPGFRRAYVEGSDDPEAELADRERPLPAIAAGDPLSMEELEPKEHATNPPARYTEASLVKKLEELGVGRPSTYASILDTIQQRDYARKRGSALVPTFTAFAVTALLERHFPQLVDYGLTAAMEDDLDEIANGAQERIPWLRRFYFGNGRAGLRTLVSERLDEIDPVEINSIPIGGDIVVRVGKYGPYLQRGEARASVPEDLAPDELTPDRAEALLEAPSGDRELGLDPASGLPVYARVGRFGPYVQLGAGDSATKTKPRTASLFSSMSLDTVSLEEALRLLTLPRVVGVDPADGEPITAQNGRYGPYLAKGNDSRSLETEEQLFTVSLEEALAIFAQPKLRRGQQRAAAPPLAELGDDPVSGQPVVVKEGRFGPYVTDGETNASLRSGDRVESMTLERAAELLADRRARGPSPKARKKASATKKAAPKKAAAKAAGSKKAAAKAAGSKKAAAKKAAGSKKSAAKKAAAAKASGAKKGTRPAAPPDQP
ncbi:MAG: type I DNA topoisomerase [Actinobacteria bacterium]|nr:type I DNA topoisomerase [Actinomycetota bacterium]